MNTFASDILLSTIALYFGGSIDDYDEFAEVWFKNVDSRLTNNRVAFLHQVKKIMKKWTFPKKMMN